MEATEITYDQVAAFFENSVLYELGQCGVGQLYNCEIHVSPGIGMVTSFIRQAPEEGKRRSLYEILKKLGRQEDVYLSKRDREISGL